MEGLPGGQLHGQVGRDAPGQVDVVLPLLLRQADVLGPPVGDAGLQGLLRGDGQLLGGQRVVPRGQPLDLTGLRGGRRGGEGRATKREKKKTHTCIRYTVESVEIGTYSHERFGLVSGGSEGEWVCVRRSPAGRAAASGASCSTCAAGSLGCSSWTCLREEAGEGLNNELNTNSFFKCLLA